MQSIVTYATVTYCQLSKVSSEI